jgi:DNA mismatch repair protein MutS
MSSIDRFIADKQTLDDLNLLGKYKPDSLYSLFNQVRTDGGAKLLDHMFRHPLTDPDEINRRSAVFQYFGRKALSFPIGNEVFIPAENYLATAGDENFLIGGLKMLRKKMLGSIAKDEEYAIIVRGLLATIDVLHTFQDFTHTLEDKDSPFLDQTRKINQIFSDKRLTWLREERFTARRTANGESEQRLSWIKAARYDYLLRKSLRAETETIMGIIYYLDVYIAVSGVARSKGFAYACALPKERHTIQAAELRHPRLEKAVGNEVSLRHDSNVLFLTGANMAGKSTFMKSFGIAVYLAHMGFPVAAREMTFSVRDGIYSSINVPDNLSLGYSHFYAEVLRVKKVAQEVSASKNLIVIFDELFKGTNVKDAYDATLSITAALSGYRNCFFIISTHITEVGEKLKESCTNLQFAYLPTRMEGAKPVYTYKLQEGITADRHGMVIIGNERILEILQG